MGFHAPQLYASRVAKRPSIKLERASAKHRKPFFLWWLHFSEIKQERGGFDVDIANPPFVRMELIMDEKPALKRRFAYLFAGRADLYVYFYGLALHILRDGGCLTFISSNTYLNSKFGERSLRQHFLEIAALRTLIDFAETKVFDAVAEPAIIVMEKVKVPDAEVRVVKWLEQQSLEELPEVASHAGHISLTSFTSDPWRLETPRILSLLDHLKDPQISKPLGSYVEGDVFYGVKETGLNEAFVIDSATRDRFRKDPRNDEAVCRGNIRPTHRPRIKDKRGYQEISSMDLGLSLEMRNSNNRRSGSGMPCV